MGGGSTERALYVLAGDQIGKRRRIASGFPKLRPEAEAENKGERRAAGGLPEPDGRLPDRIAPILVVDDRCEFTEMAQEALTDIGYRVVVAYSAVGFAVGRRGMWDARRA